MSSPVPHSSTDLTSTDVPLPASSDSHPVSQQQKKKNRHRNRHQKGLTETPQEVNCLEMEGAFSPGAGSAMSSGKKQGKPNHYKNHSKEAFNTKDRCTTAGQPREPRKKSGQQKNHKPINHANNGSSLVHMQPNLVEREGVVQHGGPPPGRGPPRGSRGGQYPQTPPPGGQKGAHSLQSPGNTQSARAKDGKKKAQKRLVYEPYMSPEDVSDGLKRNQLIDGPLRINPKNFEDAYVPHPDGVSDIYICGQKNRNRALNGDIVVVNLLPRDQWKILPDDVPDEMRKLYESQSRPSSIGLKDTSSESEKEPGASNIVENIPIEANRIPDGATSMPAEEVTTVTEENMMHSEDIKVPDTGAITKNEGTDGMNSRPKSKTQNKNTDPDKVSRTPNRDKKTPIKPNKGTPNKAVETPQKGNDSQRQRYTTLREYVGAPPGEEKKEEYLQKMENFPEKCLLRTGKVVYISERKHSRACTGNIRLLQDNNPDLALFAPIDHRMPRIMVPMNQCPDGFRERPDDFKSTLFIARITEWNEYARFPKGLLARSLGEAGEIEPETEGILIEYDVDYAEFSDKALACLPSNLPWSIPPSEFEYRRDLRSECIFTIDPATARDLDDALSCKPLPDGTLEVGVHIADVTYFIEHGNDLDLVARDRATSVYLVQKVIPMLPRLLCEQLCSLNPDEDRLTFSVIWKMTKEGQILDEWFGRSVIRSCVKLAYDHAQGFIEEPDRNWSEEELPPISTGYSVAQIKSIVLQLHQVAKHLRKKRFDSGALHLNQVKLQYALDKESGLPCGYSVYQQRDSNKLVEEFMLLANMAVAHKIYRTFPESAVLRRHPPPQTKMLDDLDQRCASLGVPVNTSDAGALQRSLNSYCGESLEEQARLQILIALCTNPMQEARYFCTGLCDDEDKFRHYALNVPLYTHFTSPIRRYPDMMVHRLLAAALGYMNLPEQKPLDIQKTAFHCNDKKKNSKRVQELSSDMFFAIFVKECGPLEERGMVMGVLDKAFDVLVLNLGVVKRIYCERLPLKSYQFNKEQRRPRLQLTWPEDKDHPDVVTQSITIFTMVNCVLEADTVPLKWKATIKHPNDPVCVRDLHGPPDARADARIEDLEEIYQ